VKTLNLNYMSRLDHIRFFAATLVIYHHFRGGIEKPESINTIGELVRTWLYGGASGVSLFLVLSGFLFCLITDAGRKQINYKSFIYNRILRIFPLLIFVFFIVICVTRRESTPLDILRLITLQLNTGDPISGWGAKSFPIGPIWTIAVEFQFYLIFPLLSALLFERGIRYIVQLCGLLIATKYLMIVVSGPEIYYNLYHTIIGRLDQLLIGMIIGALYLKGRLDFLSNPLIAITASLAAFAGLTAIFLTEQATNFSAVSFTLEAIAWGVVICSYLKAPFPQIGIIDKALVHLGSISFSTYLLHLMVGSAIVKYFQLTPAISASGSILQTSVYIIPAVFIASTATYNLIEKPFLTKRVKYLLARDQSSDLYRKEAA